MSKLKEEHGSLDGTSCGQFRRLKSHLLGAFRWIEQLRPRHPARHVLFGYIIYICAGWFLLCLPFAQKGAGVSALDNLFTATSAVSTTGLVTVSVADRYNLFGQLVVLALIQLGGIGYMTLGSFVILARRRELPAIRSEIGYAVFSLPASFRVTKFLVSVIIFTLVIEVIGAAALYPGFVRDDVPSPLWCSIFHSVSAFCTAGFSLFNTSFEAYVGNFQVNLILSVLSYLGGIGFIVCVDVWRLLRGKVMHITLTSKIIISVTFWLTVVGTTLLFITEPSLQRLPVDKRLLAALFQCMTAMTTVGFNTINIGAMSKASILLVIVLMVIGASPSGTGGGIKSTTFSAVLGLMTSAMRGEREVRFWGKIIPIERLITAFASLGFYLFALVIGTYLLELTEPSQFAENFFEAASALGTVGLSMGITAALTPVGKLIVTVLMFCGRVGPLTFGTALFYRTPNMETVSDNDLAV